MKTDILDTSCIKADTVNERIAICRRLANLSQLETAEKLGMNVSTYNQMERKGNITVNTVMTLSEIFNVHPNFIFYGYTTSKPEEKTEKIILDPIPEPQPITTEPPKSRNSITQAPVEPLTNTEANLIRIIRTISAADRKEIIDFAKSKHIKGRRRRSYYGRKTSNPKNDD